MRTYVNKIYIEIEEIKEIRDKCMRDKRNFGTTPSVIDNWNKTIPRLNTVKASADTPEKMKLMMTLFESFSILG